MHRTLKWSLAGSCVLSALALWLEQPKPVVAAVDRQATDTSTGLGIADRLVSTETRSIQPQPLPSAWSPAVLAAAERDIFAPAEATPPPPTAPAASPVLQELPAPSPPTAPEVHLRYLGRMQTPEGETVVYLSAGDHAQAVRKGDVLANGYIVDTIAEDGIHLLYPASQHRVVIATPQPST